MSDAPWKYPQVYAIVRIDDYGGPNIELRHLIAVKKVVWTQDVAEREVKRLNRLNAPKGCLYFWQVTRLEQIDP
jgi:hypothetical protein